MAKLTKKQGQHIAELINQMFVAELLVKEEFAKRENNPNHLADHALVTRWRSKYDFARDALRALGIPVVA